MQQFKKPEAEKKNGGGAAGRLMKGLPQAPDVSGTLDEIDALLTEKAPSPDQQLDALLGGICGCFGDDKRKRR